MPGQSATAGVLSRGAWWRLLVRHGRLTAAVLGITVSSAVIGGALDPIFQRIVIDGIVQSRPRHFALAALTIVVMATFTRVLSYWSARATQRLKNALAAELSLEAAAAFYRLPYRGVMSHEPGYFVSRIFDEPARTTTDVVDTAVRSAHGVVVLASALTVALWLSWKLAFVLAVVGPALFWLSRRVADKIARATKEASEQEAVLKDGLSRAVSAYRAVRIFELTGLVDECVRTLMRPHLQSLDRRAMHTARFQGASRIFLSYAELAVIVGAGIEVLRHEMTLGALFAFLSAFWRVANAISLLSAQWPIVARLRGQVQRLAEFVDTPPPRPTAGSGVDLSLTGVTVTYDAVPVLRDLTMTVGMGERLLVTGANGTGKSTLAHVLVGLLDVDAGESSTPHLSRVSAQLLPAAFLPGDLRQNVGFARLSPERAARAMALAEQLGLADKLHRDPASLSQGEQRKAQILLALSKTAELYVFDEPLSNIDSATKHVIMSAIVEATEGARLVVIMHGDDEYRDRFDRELHLGAAPFSPAPSPRTENDQRRGPAGGGGSSRRLHHQYG